jgi:hypothetical protein
MNSVETTERWKNFVAGIASLSATSERARSMRHRDGGGGQTTGMRRLPECRGRSPSQLARDAPRTFDLAAGRDG